MNQKQEYSWWVKILADKPTYIYYFGPFKSYYEAELCKNDYIQDLSQEEDYMISTQINQCQPSNSHYENDYHHFMNLS